MNASAQAMPVAQATIDRLYEGAGPDEWAFLTGEALGCGSGWGKRPYRVADLADRRRMAEDAVELGNVRATVATFKTRRSREAHNVSRAYAAMVDLDASECEEIDRLSILIASGGSSNGRRHLHGVALLDRGVDRRELEELQRGLCDQLGGDDGWGATAAETVRIPGTEHRKAGRLRRVELISDSGHRHDPSDLPHAARRTSRATSTPSPNDLPADLEQAVRAMCKVGLGDVRRGASREGVGYGLALQCRRLGASCEQSADFLLDLYVDQANAIGGRDHNYLPSELVGAEYAETRQGAVGGSVGSAFKGLHRAGEERRVDRRRFDPADVRAWRRAALADERQSPYEHEVVNELARRMLGAGSSIVTAGTRSLALALSCQPKTITHALNGTKKYPGLLGRWIRKARKGVDGAQRWTIRMPGDGKRNKAPASPIEGIYRPSSPANCGPVFLPSHDAFGYRALGQSIRHSLAALAAFKDPVSLADFASSPFVHRSARTLAVHVGWLEIYDLATRSGDLWSADLDDLERKLDEVACDLGTAGLRHRLARRFDSERELDRKRRAAYGERCAEERERRTRERIGRRARERRRRRMREAFEGLPAKRSPTTPTKSFGFAKLPPLPRSHIPRRLSA